MTKTLGTTTLILHTFLSRISLSSAHSTDALGYIILPRYCFFNTPWHVVLRNECALCWSIAHADSYFRPLCIFVTRASLWHIAVQLGEFCIIIRKYIFSLISSILQTAGMTSKCFINLWTTFVIIIYFLPSVGFNSHFHLIFGIRFTMFFSISTRKYHSLLYFYTWEIRFIPSMMNEFWLGTFYWGYEYRCTLVPTLWYLLSILQ